MTPEPTVPESLTGISATAFAVALLRAQESDRSDRLFADPYARHFLRAVDPAVSPWAAQSSPETRSFVRMMAGQVAVRTRFLDRALLEAVEQGCEQVVLLAAGMDARAYRLAWPAGATVFELDFADVLSFKSAVLGGAGAEPACHRVEVATDLREDWPRALAESGFDPGRPAAWLAEGILYALPPEAADRLLDRITAVSAPGSVLALDHGTDSALFREARAAISAELVALWRGGPAERLDTWLARRGWRPAVCDVVEVAAGYGRPAPPAFDPADPRAGHGWLATARLPSGH
ncbi:SAM-dependent methyltransferase [Nonomuraea sp. K274]|uniref:S-adenosyl-L-methionine-dependent methyltransferase n=1 Tax=Nonomuraea cypriaca TaxID=1187855 RepID=A0A931A6T4_9ACTN|nr:SAM-dependent methyltransferase [Nonomuraea cypriaca]MBF8187422.1 SAM-dependent methyltransferase [Nonomuraea cypriaca]